MSKWSFGALRGNLAALAIGMLVLLGAAPTGALWITTLPTGADVWLDGTYLGRSPLLVDALTAGEHKLTLTRTGWTPQDVSATVAPGQTVTTAVVLRHETAILAGTGTIAIHGPHPATVTLDGVAVAVPKDGVLPAPAGVHELAFVSGTAKVTRTLTVYPQTRTDVILTPEGETRSAVIAPVDDYLPPGSYRVDGSQIVARFGGHEVQARLGTTEVRVDGRVTSYDAAPTMINGRLYLPMDLLGFLNPGPLKK